MIPYAVDAPFDRQPVVNWLILGGLVLVFALQVVTGEKQVIEAPLGAIEAPLELIEAPTAKEKVTKKAIDEEQAVTGPMGRFILDGWGIEGLLGHMWLHINIICMIGSLVFLWPFGNAVCSKIGNGVYLPIYVVLGLLAGVSHLILGGGPAVGASAAISGIVGMYLVFFPENLISCFFLVPHPVTFSISGFWVIFLWFVFDIVASIMSGRNIVCCVHIECFAAGIGLAILMLKKNWVVMEKDEKSLLQMLSREKKQEEEKEGEEKKEGVTVREKAEPERERVEVEKADDGFIRFRCPRGHKIKVRKEHAGKTGRCPRCSAWVEAPR